MSSKPLSPVAALLSVTVIGNNSASAMENNTKAATPKVVGVHHHYHHHGLVKKIMKTALVCVAVTLASLLFYITVFPGGSYYDPLFSAKSQDPLDTVLRNATMKDKTIIVTTLNDAWAEPNSIFDLFLESFRIGNNTSRLLKHLVVICLDQKAYARCLALHPHCYQLYTEGANFTSEAAFMSSDYLQMMWRRIQFLTSILEKGYSFVFTDTDIMWLRDPFPQFFPDADFQIACDYFRGDSYDVNNLPNGGFTYVISNKRTTKFYNFWYMSRQAYPNNHDQDVLNKIKSDPFIPTIGLKMRFLDTKYFGGFCQPSKDLNLVCTMHANCCVGLENKVNDLRILLQDWRNYMALPPPPLPPPSSSSPNTNSTTPPTTMPSWTVPLNCSTSFQRQRQRQRSGRHLL
ncbi:uncharacterized protein At4g15970-like [Argentina anserina]|uniref:uncharacterized protein At4g15970-like n=1 Tax=Argentina anserina TaxID=57926 RepID=UPI002176415E|nr:uncharacterized protein At4g15970-like [Potentilla anserina]